MHGPPLEHPSCDPPTPSSPHLTVGTPDANGAAAASDGLRALCQVTTGNPATPQDEADVQVQVSLTDVRNRADLDDYTGDLEARTTLRITDRASGHADARGPHAARARPLRRDRRRRRRDLLREHDPRRAHARASSTRARAPCGSSARSRCSTAARTATPPRPATACSPPGPVRSVSCSRPPLLRTPDSPAVCGKPADIALSRRGPLLLGSRGRIRHHWPSRTGRAGRELLPSAAPNRCGRSPSAHRPVCPCWCRARGGPRAGAAAAAVTLPPGFQQSTALSGFNGSDGPRDRTQRAGVRRREERRHQDLRRPRGSRRRRRFADLRTEVHNYSSRGLLGHRDRPATFPPSPTSTSTTRSTRRSAARRRPSAPPGRRMTRVRAAAPTSPTAWCPRASRACGYRATRWTVPSRS